MLPGFGPPPSLGRKPAPPVDEPEATDSDSSGGDEEAGKLVHLTKNRPQSPQNRRKSVRMSRPRSMSLATSPLAKSSSASSLASSSSSAAADDDEFYRDAADDIKSSMSDSAASAEISLVVPTLSVDAPAADDATTESTEQVAA
jgi:hypothetical protein